MNKNQQNQSTDEQDLNRELISTVTATVLQTLKETGQTSGESKEYKNSKTASKTVDLVGMLFHILERAWIVLLSAVLCGMLMGMDAENSVTTYNATAKLYIVNKDSSGVKMADLQVGTALTLDYQGSFQNLGSSRNGHRGIRSSLFLSTNAVYADHQQPGRYPYSLYYCYASGCKNGCGYC